MVQLNHNVKVHSSTQELNQTKDICFGAHPIRTHEWKLKCMRDYIFFSHNLMNSYQISGHS